jgi:hypothetical protein
MAPEITISPSNGEDFPVKKIHVSSKALLAAAPVVIMSDIDFATGKKGVSDVCQKNCMSSR